MNLLEDSKEDYNDESFQNAMRATFEEHDSKVEDLQKEQDVSKSIHF